MHSGDPLSSDMDHAPMAVLSAISASSMVTLMRDLAALTTLAHETFSNVSERVSDMATRTSQLAERAEAALADVDALRVAIDAETSVLRLAHAPPVEWHASMPSGPGVDRELITNDTLGKPWATWREEAVPPPAELDMLEGKVVISA